MIHMMYIVNSLLFLPSLFPSSLPSSPKIVNHKVPSETRSQTELTNTNICNRSKKPKAWKPGFHECWMDKRRYLERQGSYPISYKRKKKIPFIRKDNYPSTSTTCHLKSSPSPSGGHKRSGGCFSITLTRSTSGTLQALTIAGKTTDSEQQCLHSQQNEISKRPFLQISVP